MERTLLLIAVGYLVLKSTSAAAAPTPTPSPTPSAGLNNTTPQRSTADQALSWVQTIFGGIQMGIDAYNKSSNTN